MENNLKKDSQGPSLNIGMFLLVCLFVFLRNINHAFSFFIFPINLQLLSIKTHAILFFRFCFRTQETQVVTK